MKLLFFDIECSNCFGGIGKVCEYGAVLTDENFNIISQYDIPMCPGKGRFYRFDTSIYERDKDFDWAYSPEYYFECPKFPTFYNTIKNIMEDNEIIVLGYSVDNDIRYLYSACKQYNLEQIKFKAYDIQKIKRLYSNNKQKIKGLKGAFLEFYDNQELSKLTQHLSRDDAKMTMMVLKEICKKMEMTPAEILELCDDCSYESEEYMNKHLSKKGNICINNECKVIWENFYKQFSNQLYENDSLGKIVTISNRLKENMDDLSITIKTIKDNGLIAYDRINGSNYIIVSDEEDKDRLTSYLRHPYKGKILLLQEFKNLFKEEKTCFLL